MSWFDTAKFSKYAKNALKQAQQNIDKVLDIKDDDDVLPNKGGIADDFSSNQRTSTPKSSSAYVIKESDSFFDSFLGGDSVKKSNNAASKSETSIDASKRRGRLKDRTKEKSDNQVSTLDDPGTKDDELDKKTHLERKPSINTCKDSLTTSPVESILTPLSNSTAEIGDDSSRRSSYLSSITKDDEFDDIDLTDSDSNATDDIEKAYITAAHSNTLHHQNEIQSDSFFSVDDSLSYVTADSKNCNSASDLDLALTPTPASQHATVDMEYNDSEKELTVTSESNISSKHIAATDFNLVSESESNLKNKQEKNIENVSGNEKEENLAVGCLISIEECKNDWVTSENNSLINFDLPEVTDNAASSNKDIISDMLEEVLVPVSLPEESLDQETVEKELLATDDAQSVPTKEMLDQQTSDLSLGALHDICDKDVNIDESSKDNLDGEFKECVDMKSKSQFIVTVNDKNDSELPIDNECDVKSKTEILVDDGSPKANNEIKVSIEDNLSDVKCKADIVTSDSVYDPKSKTETWISEAELAEENQDKYEEKCEISNTEEFNVNSPAAGVMANDSCKLSSPDVSVQCTKETALGDSVLENILKVSEVELVTRSSDSDIRLYVHDENPFTNQEDDSMNKSEGIEDNSFGDSSKAHVDLQIPERVNLEDANLEKVNSLKEQISNLSQEVTQLRSVIDARELKLVELSKENISFQESVSIYKSQIAQLEEVNRHDDTEMENLRTEFTKRIGECDSKCQAAIKERDQYKAKYIDMEAQLRQSANEQISMLTNSLLEKEETIKDLLTEGENLSRKELESNTRIKKLRVKLKEVNTKNTTLTEQNESFEVEAKKLKEFIKEKEASEKRLEGELKKLEGITDSQEDEVSTLREQMDDMEEKYKAMETTLHNTYAEINKLNLEKAQKESEVQEASSAVEAKMELEMQLKDLEKKSKLGKEELIIQLEDLQTAYSRLEQQLGRREDELKREIEDLHKRLEHGENRNLELSQSVTAATRPLLRQIENLQNSFSTQSDSWERVEKNLTDRLMSLQDQLALAMEKERAASEVAVEAKARLKAVEERQRNLKNEKINLEISLEQECERRKEIESEWKRERSSFEMKLTKLKELTKELQDEKGVLEEQLAAEEIRYENDCLRMSTQLSIQQHQMQQQSNSFSQTHSRSSSIAGDVDILSQSEPLPHPLPLQRYLSSSGSFNEGFQKTDSVPRNTTAASIEHLRSVLRSREGEVFVLQEEIKSLEKTKASLAQELVTLANRVEELEETNTQLENLREKYAELKSRHDAVLQMYGEKAEEADELRMDLEDVKNMYRQQIQELCGNT